MTNLMRIFAVCFIIMVSVGATSCQRKKDDLFKAVDADVWLHDKLPPEICDQHPDLRDGLGVYRKVRCTEQARVAGLCGPEDRHYEEVIPYCDPKLETHISMAKTDFKKWIDLAKREINECLQ